MVSELHIQFDLEKVKDFCLRWNIVELALFGSVLRNDFRPDSDMDVLVRCGDDAAWGWEASDAQEELEALLGRAVDLVSWKAIERSGNYILRNSILRNNQVVYEAG